LARRALVLYLQLPFPALPPCALPRLAQAPPARTRRGLLRQGQPLLFAQLPPCQIQPRHVFLRPTRHSSAPLVLSTLQRTYARTHTNTHTLHSQACRLPRKTREGGLRAPPCDAPRPPSLFAPAAAAAASSAAAASGSLCCRLGSLFGNLLLQLGCVVLVSALRGALALDGARGGGSLFLRLEAVLLALVAAGLVWEGGGRGGGAFGGGWLRAAAVLGRDCPTPMCVVCKIHSLPVACGRTRAQNTQRRRVGVKKKMGARTICSSGIGRGLRAGGKSAGPRGVPRCGPLHGLFVSLRALPWKK
jgi:hypothetical protein